MKYPTDEQLETIRNWKNYNIHSLFDYIYDFWHWPEWGWKRNGDTYFISTGGWSGNEDIIDAMQSNSIWWGMFWELSKRGGHYIFSP